MGSGGSACHKAFSSTTTSTTTVNHRAISSSSYSSIPTSSAGSGVNTNTNSSSSYHSNENLRQQPSNPNLKIETLSPRRSEQDDSMSLGIPETPSDTDKNSAHYRYYCPICMNYFKSILKSSCCGNYICLSCCKSYLLSKNLLAESVIDIVGNKHVSDVDCPNCGISERFDPTIVSSDDAVRSYKSSYGAAPTNSYPNSNSNSSSSPSTFSTTSSSSYNYYAMHSPLKAGDTFEDLKRKTKRYTSHTTTTTTSCDPFFVLESENSFDIKSSTNIQSNPNSPQKRLFADHDNSPREVKEEELEESGSSSVSLFDIRSSSLLFDDGSSASTHERSTLISSIAQRYIVDLVDDIVSNQKQPLLDS